MPELLVQKLAHDFAGRQVSCGLDKEGSPKFKRLSLSHRQVVGIVSVAKAQLDRPAFFASAPIGAAFRDTFVRLRGNVVVREELTRDHRVRADMVSPFDIRDECEAPERTMRALHEIWADTPDADARIQYLFEWLGLALLGIATRYKDSPLIVGRKDTGKSTVLNALSSVFPEKATTHITLHDMAKESYRAKLAVARLNFVNELPSRDLMDSEPAKALLSGDPVECRRLYKDPFELISRAAHAFAANELPPTLDVAFAERFVVLRCTRVFSADEQDKTLPDKLRAEAPRIARAALLAAQNALDRGRLVRPPSAEREGQGWLMSSNSVAQWAQDYVEVDSEGFTQSSELFSAYRNWCGETNHRALSTTKWAARMRELGYDRYKSSTIRWRVRLLRGIWG